MELTYKDNPEEIIDILLKYHDVDKLKNILNNKARQKSKRGNTYFVVAVKVYMIKYLQDSKLEWAINNVAEKTNTSDKTIKNHITKFRKEIKKYIKKLNNDSQYSLGTPNEVNSFIRDYVARISNDTYSYHGEEAKYRSILHDFIGEINLSLDIPF